MAKSAVTTDIHETLDVSDLITAEVTLNFVIIFKFLTDGINLFATEIIGRDGPVDTHGIKDLESGSPTYTVDVSQCNIQTLVSRKVYSSDTSHSYTSLSLTLFVSGVFTNNPQHALASDYFAFGTNLLNRWSYFHDRLQIMQFYRLSTGS